MALRDAAAHGLSVAGATAYVTLEPCSHHGRTGPCCDALIAAGIAGSSRPHRPEPAGRPAMALRACAPPASTVEVGPGRSSRAN
jgi:diaminohydroxyphosphoribosylaminopyrimidine deaminase/5-amino-6-(5-phosphoribosylamino)uracil reductase